jgi:hypothetical protein
VTLEVAMPMCTIKLKFLRLASGSAVGAVQFRLPTGAVVEGRSDSGVWH